MVSGSVSIVLMSLSVLAALIAAVVAWKQYRIAKIANRMSVFKRRIAIHDAITAFLAEFMHTNKISENAPTDLLRSTREAKFLFGQEVVEYIRRVYGRALEFQTRLTSGTGNLEEKIELVNWMTAQFDEVDRLFRPYLEYREK
jgi:hypothetical protein